MKVVDPRIYNRFGADFVGRAGDELIYLCPFCEDNGKTPDTKGHLYVNTKNYLYFCQRCGAKGYVGPSEVEYEFDPIPTDEELYGLLEDALGRDDSSERVFPIPPNLVDPQSDAGIYLSNRGITPDIVEYYSIRQGQGRYMDRVIVPNVVTHDPYEDTDVTDMYVGRYIREIPVDSEGHQAFPKYVNPIGANKSHIVFNLHRIPKGDPIVICEGVFSAISAGKRAVAIYGKSISDRQLQMILANSPSMVYVCLDPDARREAGRLCYRLSARTSAPIFDVRLPDGHDPNSLGTDAFMGYLTSTRRFDPVERGLFGIYS